MSWLIGQSASPEQLSRTLLYGAMVLMGLLAVAWIAVAWAKKRSQAPPESSSTLPFTLHDLRHLHDEGQLTDEEFEKARARIVAMSKAAIERKGGKSREPGVGGQVSVARNQVAEENQPKPTPPPTPEPPTTPDP